jgi:hypothetical protein
MRSAAVTNVLSTRCKQLLESFSATAALTALNDMRLSARDPQATSSHPQAPHETSASVFRLETVDRALRADLSLMTSFRGQGEPLTPE